MNMNMHLRSYRPSDLAEIAVLLYDTVHTVTIKDYSAAQRNAWASGKVNSEQWNNVGRGQSQASAEATTGCLSANGTRLPRPVCALVSQ